MKNTVLSLIVFVCINSFANPDWGRQVCLSNGGKILQLELQFSSSKNIEICMWGNQSFIELNTLDLSRFNSYNGPEANRAYRETAEHDFAACQRKFGRIVRAKDVLSTWTYDVCEFNDRSWIGNITLTDGYRSVWNQQLNQALGIF